MYRVFSMVTTHKSLEGSNVRRLCQIALEIYEEYMLFKPPVAAAS